MTERLDPKEGTVECRLCQFSGLCNKDSPHPRDWRRFYLFAVYAHQRRVQWDEYDLRSRLKPLALTKDTLRVFPVPIGIFDVRFT